MEDLDLDGMSIEEMRKHESEQEGAGEDNEAEAEEVAAAEPEKAEEVADGSGNEDQGPDQKEEIAPEADKVADEEVEHKDISPPEKWIAQRHRARQQKVEQEYQAEQSSLQQENEKLRQTIQYLKSSGVDVPDSPLDALSEENIKNVREEFGDNMANMLLALKPQQAAPTKKAVDEQGVDDQDADQERIDVIMQNDHLAYWHSDKEQLWSKAVEAEESLSKDPSFMSKPYNEQAELIVEKVKELVLSEKKPKNPAKSTNKGEPGPPLTLAGTAGTAPANDNKGPVSRMIDLADSGDTDGAMKIYNSLPDGDAKLKFENWMEENEEG